MKLDKKLLKASQIAIVDCMGLQKDEKILIICDKNTRNIAYHLFEISKKYSNYKPLLIEIPVANVNGEEPPEVVADIMKKFDVVLCPTTKSLTHTQARIEASKIGVRIATFPGITEDIMIRGMNADYKKISEETIKLCNILEQHKSVTIKTKLGTNLSFSIDGRKAFASKGLFHAKGESGNLPTGEAYLAPIEGTANGIAVFDGSFASIGMLDEPITLTIKDGYVTKISGGKQAKELQKMLKPFGKDAYNIAEFGIGTNDKAKLSGNILEDEKVKGTIHIALGNNKSMGGNVGIGIHLDGLIIKPDVWLDDRKIMEKGKLLV
ncbi:MAG TPA: aminopeptidase [Ignavibacteriales bacterium]|nr:aminopeptidase [Ignavibacteriales bacterium]HOL81177.1 aminopeptidase [Ignavibacteriales bacterium]HPP33467.1 aminopeptidase [Ignavibacteriales bacterium]